MVTLEEYSDDTLVDELTGGPVCDRETLEDSGKEVECVGMLESVTVAARVTVISGDGVSARELERDSPTDKVPTLCDGADDTEEVNVIDCEKDLSLVHEPLCDREYVSELEWERSRVAVEELLRVTWSVHDSVYDGVTHRIRRRSNP